MNEQDLTPGTEAHRAETPEELAAEQSHFPERTTLSRRGRWLSWVLGLVGLALVIALAVYLSHSSSPQGQGQGGGRRGGPGGGMNQPTTVGTAKATKADLPVQVEALGTVTPAASVTVRPRVSGTITQLLYREGQIVQRGQALAIIDPRPYQAALLQAQGALTRDQAQLANARIQLQRYQTLQTQDSIARQDVDTQAALVHQLEGTVAVDRGAMQQAQINLGFTRVVAPVSGRIGLKVVDLGNYIAAGDTNGIAVVTTLQPIDVEFSVPQQNAPQIAKRVAAGADIPALALDSNRTQTLDNGHFSTLDNQVDTTTGTIKGKARFANAGFQLYPNQFVNVRLVVDTVKDAVTVPPSAVRSGPDGNFVWLLNADRTVTMRKVTIGASNATMIQILSGLNVGDIVVTEGGDRLNDGTKVALPGDKPTTGGGGQKRRKGSGGANRGANG